MKRILNILFFGIVSICSTYPLSGQTILLNECMASNSRTVADATGSFEDWIELYNPGNVPVNLSGYYITDDLGNLQKHKLLPIGNEMVIPAKGYLVLWASNHKERGPLHLGFGLSGGGESLALVAPDGITLLDSLIFGTQKQDISFGRTADGTGNWLYLEKATPGSSNNTSKGYSGFLSPPVFSKPGGFYNETFQLGLSTTQPGATIIYTLDGSEPDPENINGKAYHYKNSYPGKVGDGFGPLLTDTLRSILYQGDLVLRDRTADKPSLANKSSTVDAIPFIPPPDFFKGTCVRARVIKDGFLPSEIITQTYFISPKGSERYSLPVAAVTLPPNQLFGYEEGIYNAGEDFDTWRKKNPLETSLFRADINFSRSGDLSERIGNFEYLTGNTTVINQQIGVRLHGSAGRFKLIKPLRLYARIDLGRESFDYPFFAGYPFGSFKRIILRPDDFDKTALRDMVVQHLAKGLRFDIQQGQPSVLFINGEYWGLHFVRERYDRYYLERKYGIPDGDLDLLEDNALAEEGDNKDYLELKTFIKTKDQSNPANFAYVRSKMDIENFADYFINEMFIANHDWPNNNIRFYKKKSPVPQATIPEQDGRWRWLLFDTDASFTNYQATDNYFEKILAIENVFLKNLMIVPEFRDYFITRYADLLNSVYQSSMCSAKIDSVAALIKPFIPEHRYRLVNDSSSTPWLNGITDMKNFARRRPAIVRQQMKEYFNLGDTQRITVNVLQPEMGYVNVNTLALKAGTPGVANNPYPWQGIYFGGMPLRLIAEAKPGYRFVKWLAEDSSSIKDTLILNLSRPVKLEAVFEPDIVPVKAPLIHYWHFNNLPSGTLQSIGADSSMVGKAVITYPGTGAGYLDRVTAEGSVLNTQYGTDAGTALRVRNPSNTRELKISVPSDNFGDIAVSWATIRTGSGAQEQKVFYSTDEGNLNWKELKAANSITEVYQLYSFDLKEVAAANNNPNLALKVVFAGSNAAASGGNNRFDNITVTGKPLNELCNGSTPRVWYRDADNDGFSDGTRLVQCSRPEGYKLITALSGTVVDCNDQDAFERPGAVWYKDTDNDGFSDGIILVQCTQPQGYKNLSALVSNARDCRDNDAFINPATVWYKDEDGDGYSNGIQVVQCEKPVSFFLAKDLKAISGDCNDADSASNPETIWYRDKDGDGFTDGVTLRQCLRPDGYKPLKELINAMADCNDDDPETSPQTLWYKDRDGDGFSDGITLSQCLMPSGYKRPATLISVSGDCNDTDAILNPKTIWYKDADNDGYSDGVTMLQCLQPVGYKLPAALTAIFGDCNDTAAAMNPETVWFKDRDGDGYSDGITRVQCERPSGFALPAGLIKTDGDCNDQDVTVFPGATELPDRKDNDCNGMVDEGPALDIRVVPNPVHQQLGLWLKVFEPGRKIEISLINTDGRVYLLGALNPVQFGQRIQMDVRNHAAGTYILRIQQGENQLTRKILIIR